MSNVIKEAKLICCDIGSNHNKYYTLQLLDDNNNNNVRITYGRISTDGTGNLKVQSDETFPGGEAFFNKKLNEKIHPRVKGKKPYVYAKTIDNTAGNNVPVGNRNIEEIAIKEIVHNSPEVTKLIRELAQANIHQILTNSKISYNVKSGTFSTPMGVVTQDGVDEARRLLSDIKTFLDSNNTGQEFEDSVDSYLRIVPRDLGRRRQLHINIFPNNDEIFRQNSVLDSLESSILEVTKPVENNDGQTVEIPKTFHLQLDLCDEKEFNEIDKFFWSTRKNHYSVKDYKPSRLFKIEHEIVRKNYEVKGKLKGNIERLFHGTGKWNVISVLRSGLTKSPPSTTHITGKMFGPGIYFTNCSSKSLNYCTNFWGGSNSGNGAFMFIAEVAIGKYEIPNSSRSFPPPKGYDAYYAKANISGVMNDEIIVFDENCVNLVYLLELQK